LITIAISTVLSLVLLLAGMFVLLAHGSNLFGAVLSSPDLYLAPLRMVGLLPVYILWALPTVGWLLMVSSMARSKVFLWAVGTPVVTSLLLVWAEKTMQLGLNASWFAEHVVARILLGVAPGAWFAFDKLDHLPTAMNQPNMNDLGGTVFSTSWATLGNANVWIGVAAGAAMIAVAVWMRRRREEG
jgi:ABC-2 type transport system permease protein